jgi:DMSO/TMAO reductase YedYZ molybdopterin-dependent catalytic subunit
LLTGVRLKHVLNKVGVKPGAVQVRSKGLEEPVVADAPHFMKSLDIDHAPPQLRTVNGNTFNVAVRTG